MPAFQAWRNSPTDINSRERILWIRGTLGVGKTIMAGYFIELLKCLYPDAIVAYFFCRSGQAGLTKARDIIRTFAYYCIQDDPEARSRLDSLRCKELPIDDDVGIGFLFDKLLREITTKEVYIVLDGLDEADRVSLDTIERPPRPEIEILLQHLATLQSARLLFISRGEADVSRIIPNSITKSLGKDDNMKDIDTYVQQTIEGSERLKVHFQNEKIDPFKYFHDKANGIFLWVVVVLHQLSQTKSSSTFRKFLNGFSDASGNMERLYSSVLSRIEEEDRKWVHEILKWVVTTKEAIEMNVLKATVEWCLQDKLPEFQRFLEVECGSLLHLIPETFTVTLIHETLHSFLINPTSDSKGFHVDLKITAGYILRVCLNVLSGEADARNRTPKDLPLLQYAATGLLYSLARATKISSAVLISIYQFFETGGCNTWIEYENWRNYWNERENNGDDELMLYTFYERLKEYDPTINCDFSQSNESGSIIINAHRWRQEILRDPSRLGQYVGKAAAELWLYRNMAWERIDRVFCLALKYYCRTYQLPSYDLESLTDLVTNDFSQISAWLDKKGCAIIRTNLGIGAFRLQMWRDTIRYLANSLVTPMDQHELRSCLGKAYIEIGEWDKAITVLKESSRPDDRDWRLLALAYNGKGDSIGIINVLEPASTSRWAILCLEEIYTATGDHQKVIDLYERGIQYGEGTWWMWDHLAAAYIAKGDHNGASETYRRAPKYYPTQETVLSSQSPTHSSHSDYGRNPTGKTFRGSQPLQTISTYVNGGSQNPGIDETQATSSSYSPSTISNSDGATGSTTHSSHGKYRDWQVATRKSGQPHIDVSPVWIFDGPSCILSLRFSHDGMYLAAGGYRYIHVFDVMNGRRLFSLLVEDEVLSHNVLSIDFSPDGRFIAAGTNVKDIRIWEVEERALRKTLKETDSSIKSIAFSNDGKILVSGSVDGMVWVWDVNLEVPILKLYILDGSDSPLTSTIISVALSSDGRYVSAVPEAQRIIQMWDTTTGAVIDTLLCRVDSAAAFLAFCPFRAKWLSTENLSDELARGEEWKEMGNYE